MNHQALRTAAVAALAFATGLAVAHFPQRANAQPAPLQPAVIDLLAMGPADLPSPTPVFPNLRSKTLIATPGTTAAFQVGTVLKHYHADANEIQIIVGGSGTEWLGDKQIPLRPGLMLVIPAGTAHGGTNDPNLRVLSFKTPPQAPTDVHPMP